MQRYDEIGRSYAQTRRPDPRIAAQIARALGDSRTVLNVGAGTGSYEPAGREVVAVEPSVTMIAQRAVGSPPPVQAAAEALPFANATFDSAMAVLTLHHWRNLDAGLAEIRRVAGRQVILMFEPSFDATFWLVTDYLPEWSELDAGIPSVADLETRLNVESVEPVPVPADCVDGFGGAYWNRPERYLDPAVQAGISSLARMDRSVLDEAMRRLGSDLDSGEWDRRHGQLRDLTEVDLGYRLVIAGTPSSRVGNRL